MFDAAIIHYSPLKDFIYYCIAAGAGFFLGGYGAWHFYRRFIVLRDTPRSLIRSAAQGYVELQGDAKLMPGDPIFAPLTGKRCVWWEYRVETRSGIGSWRSLDRIRRDTSADIFMLEDETGHCVIDPDHAVVTPSVKDIWYGNSEMPEGGPGLGRLPGFGKYRYSEMRIEEGVPLCTLGYFHTQDPVSGAMIDEEVRQQLVAWKQDQKWLLQHFDANHDGQVDQQEWDAARQEARRLVLEKERENLKRPPVNVLSHPADGREFILSAMPRERLEARLRWLSAACLLAFFVGGAYGVFLLDARFMPPPPFNSTAP